MRAASSLARVARGVCRPMGARFASTVMRMPAMSPTMTEGGIAEWKVEEGQPFAAGDVLLEVETDKATIDVEAQDDGVLAKIMFPAGSKGVPVGEAIAVLAEEGDDLSKVEVPSDLSPEKANIPKEDDKPASSSTQESAPPAKESSPSASSSSAPTHKHVELDTSKPMFPSVMRLLQESDLSQDAISKIKPTGRNGMITQGDVLAAMGKIKSPYGTAEKLFTDPMLPGGRHASEAKAAPASSAAKPKPEPPLDGPALRRLIVAGLTKATAPKPVTSTSSASAKVTDAEFDDLLADYGALVPKPAPAAVAPAAPAAPAAQDELAGLF